MSKFKYLSAFLLLFTAFTFTSCDNEPLDSNVVINPGDDPENPGGGTQTGQFKVDFDGQTFIADVTQAIVNEDYIAITGLKTATGQAFQITIPDGGVGTYTWDDFDPANPLGTSFAMVYSQGNGTSGFLSVYEGNPEFSGFPEYTDSAVIAITEINTQNKTISGTFQFTGIRFADETGDTVEIKTFTNGSFTNLSYAADTVSPPNNTFSATVNGANYVATNVTGIDMMGNISIIGRRGNIENIAINVPNNITPGTYSMSFMGTYNGMYTIDNSGMGSFMSDTGSITISSHDTVNNKIIGTFNFNAGSLFSDDEYSITNGTFSVEY